MHLSTPDRIALTRDPVSRRLDLVNESATLRMAARARELRAEGRHIVSLSMGEPDFATPDHIKEAAKRAIDENFTKYTAAEGIPDLRKAVAEFFQSSGIETAPSRVQITSGGKHALGNALQALLNVGDEVLIPAPFWVSYPAMVRIAGGSPKIVNTSVESGWRLTPNDLRNAIGPKTKAMILNTPMNPTSGMYFEQDLRALAEVIAESGLYVIVDELYSKLTFDDNRHFSIGSIPEIADRVITINGVSKAYSMTGWRIGFATATTEIMDAMNRVQAQMVSHPSSISQRAALAALTGPQESVEAMRVAFERRRDLVISLASDVRDITFDIPQAAFYLFFDASAYLGASIATADALCEMLLEEFGVGLVSGDAFGAPGYIRLSFAASDEDIREGMARLRKGLEYAATRKPALTTVA
jgi:aspartate aminotransferase